VLAGLEHLGVEPVPAEHAGRCLELPQDTPLSHSRTDPTVVCGHPSGPVRVQAGVVHAEEAGTDRGLSRGCRAGREQAGARGRDGDERDDPGQPDPGEPDAGQPKRASAEGWVMPDSLTAAAATRNEPDARFRRPL
jgi:hypothetical protein